MASEYVSTLRAAADLLRERASKATSGVCPHWIYAAVRHINRNCDIDCSHYHADSQGPNEPAEEECSAPQWSRYDDAPWIAMMSPTVAEPLACLLELIAESAALGGVVDCRSRTVAVAEAILRGKS